MIDLGKKNVLGVNVDAVDYETAVAKIIHAAKCKQPFAVSALAVHGVMTGTLDKVHRYRLNHLDLVTPDGQPVRWALNWLYNTRLPDRVYGPTLTLAVCEQAAQEKLPIYLYGSRETTIEALSTNLVKRFPDLIISGKQPSRFRKLERTEKEEVVAQIQGSGACILLVGLGCPRQETWIFEYRDRLSMPQLAVGAAFDFHAGVLEQAPSMMQKSGLEWLYRLAKEPKRLWKRYLTLNPLFLWYLMLQKNGWKRFDPDDAVQPQEELMYG